METDDLDSHLFSLCTLARTTIIMAAMQQMPYFFAQHKAKVSGTCALGSWVGLGGTHTIISWQLSRPWWRPHGIVETQHFVSHWDKFKRPKCRLDSLWERGNGWEIHLHFGCSTRSINNSNKAQILIKNALPRLLLSGHLENFWMHFNYFACSSDMQTGIPARNGPRRWRGTGGEHLKNASHQAKVH